MLQSRRLYEIYDTVVHNATCEKSYKGLWWTFISLLLMSCSGCLMITFRAVLYPLAGVDDDDFSWNKVKEEEARKEVAPASGDDDEGEFKGYTVDTGLESNTVPKVEDEEPPMGGTASAQYEPVGDDNPSEDTHDNDEQGEPKKNSWE